MNRYLHFIGHSPWRDTLIVNAVTAGLAVGLARNFRAGWEVRPAPWPADQPAPCVAIIAPLRDEAANVDPLLATLTRQAYPAYAIIAVDDGSTDGTGAALARWADRDRRVRVVPGAPLPPGWTGKNWALAQGVAAADPRARWLLFVDADTRHHPLMLAAALGYATRERLDLLTLLPRLELGSFWERVLVPHTGELYTLLVGAMAQVNDPRSPVAAANGQWLLLRRAAYHRVGGQAAVRGAIAEDRALARRMKAAGARIRMAHAPELVRCRVYADLPTMWRGFGKTLFPAADRNLPRVLLVVAALTLYGVAPWGRLVWGLIAAARPGAPPAHRAAGQRRIAHALAQLGPQWLVRAWIARTLGLSPLYAFTYPLAVLLGNGLLLWSATRYLRGRGPAWKGRRYV
jgi:glycosyltransferase involved in cell wall biosynthesis